MLLRETEPKDERDLICFYAKKLYLNFGTMNIVTYI